MLRLLILSVALGAALACAHDTAPAPDGLRQRLAEVAVNWDEPRVMAAAQALRSRGGALRVLQGAARQVLAEHGVPAGQVALAQADDLVALAAEVERLAPARCAQAGPDPALVLCYRALVDLDATPTRLAPGAALRLRGRVLGPAQLQEILILEPTGEVRALPVVRDGRRFEIEPLTLEQGRHVLEIMVTTGRGIEVAALWRLEVSGAATSAALADDVDRLDPADGDATSAALRYYSGLLADRAAAGRGEVSWSEALASVARQRAQTLAAAGRLEHLDQETRTALTDDAGQPLSWVAENLARARSVAGARSAVLESPSHRRNHLASAAELAGVGAAWRAEDGEHVLYVVELLARSYAQLDDQTFARQVAAALNLRRNERGAPALDPDPDLDARAQRLAARLPDDPAADLALDPKLTQELLSARPELLRAGAAYFFLDRPGGIAPTASLLAARYNLVGVGARRSGPRSPWRVVVLVAEARPETPIEVEPSFGGP